jgi:TPR repeat protein
MRLWIRCAVLVLAVACMPLYAQAGSFADALAAFFRGDYATALRLYGALAAKGDADAQFWLGAMHEEGRGTPRDDVQAVRWFRLAAEQGHSGAQLVLGAAHADGRGVPRDDLQAVHWYQRAAQQGLSEAQFRLGVMHAEGRGVPRDDVQAVHWWRRAAEQGHANAQFNLGVRHMDGRTVPRDDAQAVRWFRLAAEQGDASAQTVLGAMHALGRGVPRDEQQAYFWWLLAAARGNAHAAKERDRIEARLTAQQRAAAQAQAREWRPRTGPTLAQAPAVEPRARRAEPRGSGFRVAPGRIVTNAHVIAGCAQILADGQRATRVAADTVNDLALLDLPGDRGAVAPLRAVAARLGESVTIAGFPLEGLLAGLAVTGGNVSRLSGVGGDTGQLQISAPVQPGNSGGPVLDAAGQVLGVVVSQLDAIAVARATGGLPQNVNFAIRGELLRAFLDAHGVAHSAAAGEPPLAAEAIAARARQFTVPIQCVR